MPDIHPPHPERLANRDYMDQAEPFRLFRNTVDGRIAVHWHEFYELGFILSGEGRQILNGRPLPLRKGTLFLLTPADFHELEAPPESPCLHYNLIFSDEALREELRRLLFASDRENLSCTVPEHEFGRVAADFERIAQELESGRQTGANLIVQSTIERLLIEWIRRTENGPAAVSAGKPGAEDAVRHALAYMQTHFREPLTLEDAAGRAHLSPNYFSRCFRQYTGKTFQHVLQQLRLQFARSLIRMSELPITEICFASGFNTLPHFERAFKAAFGQSPRRCRRA